MRREDDSVQWVLQDAGGGNVHIISVVDGSMLRYDGSTIDYAPVGTTGSQVEWNISREQYGWHNIIHTSSGLYLRLYRVNDANNAPVSQEFQMVTAAAASGYSSTDWWFVKPWNASDVDIDAPSSPAVAGGDGQVDITLSAVPGSLGYNLYRSVSGGSASLLAGGITALSYMDTNVVNGTEYAYSYSYISAIGLESDVSAEASAIPQNPNVDFMLWASMHGLSGPNSAFDEDWDLDGLKNGVEFAYLTDPTVFTLPQESIMSSNGAIHIVFPWNSDATNLTWQLHHKPAMTNDWSAASGTVVDTLPGTPDTITIEPEVSAWNPRFFVLEIIDGSSP
jgi:hypothetical protein